MLVVPRVSGEQSLHILQEHQAATLPDEGTEGFLEDRELAEDELACPACGHVFAEEAAACPDCGIALG